MHIVLSILGAIITILILLNRLEANGIDIGWLNPFAWKRRRDWAKKYHANPLYSISSPMEVTALIMVALAKSEGDISSQQKKAILEKFVAVFNLSTTDATDLMRSVSHLLNEDIAAVKDTHKLLEPSSASFTQEQVSSSLSLFKYISTLESPMNDYQRFVLNAFNSHFSSRFNASIGWK